MTHSRLAILVAATLLLFAGCRGEAPRDTSAPAGLVAGSASDHEEEENAIHLDADVMRDLRISTAPVVERIGAEEVAVLGEVAADQGRYAEVAPPTPGQVVRVLVELDRTVERGTPLVQLRSQELGRARADVLTANARRDLAQQTLDRKRTLAAERIVAAREVQEAEAALRAADAEARAAQASLRALGVADGDDVGAEGEDGSLFYVRSPLAGRIIERRAILGQFADTNAPLFVVADLGRVWLIAQVFERDAVNLRTGALAHVTLAALPGQEIDGRVTHIGRQVEAGSRTVPVRVELPNPDGVLRPGMSANARIEIGGVAGAQGGGDASVRTLVVPAAALQRVGERWLAFVPKGPGEFEMRPVGRGRDLGPSVEVVSGLSAGEMVVVDGAFLLKAEAEKRRGGGDEHGH